MVRITTTYDKEIQKKVFMVRGDESYAHTTDCYLELGTITVGDIKGLKIASVKVNLLRTMGSSTVVLYDGFEEEKEVLAMWNTTNSTKSVTATDVYLRYDQTHNLWAEYHHNEYCLASKSKPVDVYRETPETLKITLTPICLTEIPEDSDFEFEVEAKYNDNSTPVPDDTEIVVLVDGEQYGDAYTTSSGSITGSIEGLSKGIHTITWDTQVNSGLINTTKTIEVLVGVNIDIISYPSYWITGATNIINAKLTDLYGEPKAEEYCSLVVDGLGVATSGETDENGMVSLSIPSNLNYPCDLTVVHSGFNSSSDEITVNRLIIGTVDVQCTPNIVATGISSNIQIAVKDSNSQPHSNTPVSVTINGTTSTLYTNDRGYVFSGYDGNGNGDITVSATCGGVTDTATIEDCMNAWTPQYGWYNMTKMWKDYSSDLTLTEYTGYLELSSRYASKLQFFTDKTTAQSVSFQLNNMTNLSKIQFDNGNYIDESTVIELTGLKKGDVITFEVLSTSYKVYLNGTLIGTKAKASSTQNIPYIKFVPVNEGTTMKINVRYLKHKRISEQ